MAHINQAVIAVAGTGTRWYPYSFFTPKELLPIGGIPVIQYVVEELFTAEVNRIVVVLKKDKQAIRDYFDYQNHELIAKKAKNANLAARISRFAENLKKTEIIFCYQDDSKGYGNGVPLLFARKHLNNEPFFYTWADDFIAAKPTRFVQLAEVYEEHGTSVLSGVKAKSAEDYSNYAYIQATDLQSGLFQLAKIHEKPGLANAPSEMGVLSGHLFAAEVLESVEKAHQACNNEEFSFNDIMHEMIAGGKGVLVKEIINARYFDTGNPNSYMESINNYILYSNNELEEKV